MLEVAYLAWVDTFFVFAREVKNNVSRCLLSVLFCVSITFSWFSENAHRDKETMMHSISQLALAMRHTRRTSDTQSEVYTRRQTFKQNLFVLRIELPGIACEKMLSIKYSNNKHKT